MTIDAYADYDGVGLAELVANKDVTPLELGDAAIERIERHNPALNGPGATCRMVRLGVCHFSSRTLA